MDTMQLVRIHSFGGTEVLSLDEVPVPEPEADELLLKVHAAGINPVDVKMRSGRYPGAEESMLPLALGREVSGTVVRCGPGVLGTRVGDTVHAMLDMDRGGYAEYVTIKPSEHVLKPPSLDHVSAAAVPLAALTAWQGLFERGELRPNQRVLIHGASGGVGHLAVQFAKQMGAQVMTTSSGADLDFLRDLGASHAIDYRDDEFDQQLRDLDLVLDLIGGETRDRSFAVIRPGGKLVSTLGEPSQDKANKHGIRVAGFMARPSAVQLYRIGRMFDAGEVRVTLDTVFPLRDVAAAHAHLESRHVRGKLVLQVADLAGSA